MERQRDYFVHFMYVTAAVMILLLMTGCENYPQTPEERGIEVNYDIIKVHNQDKSMLYFENLVEWEFRDHLYKERIYLDNEWEHTTVWWADTTCQGKDPGTYGIQLGRSCVAGVMWSCDEIYVAVSGKSPGHTCGTALLHEFGHCLSGKVFGYLDGSHSNAIWDVVVEADAYACQKGW